MDKISRYSYSCQFIDALSSILITFTFSLFTKIHTPLLSIAAPEEELIPKLRKVNWVSWISLELRSEIQSMSGASIQKNIFIYLQLIEFTNWTSDILVYYFETILLCHIWYVGIIIVLIFPVIVSSCCHFSSREVEWLLKETNKRTCFLVFKIINLGIFSR